MDYFLIIPHFIYTFSILFLIVVLLKQKNNSFHSYGSLQAISIVIPFRNEENNLKQLIESLNEQKYNGTIELILVNDGSTDNSVNIINTCIKNIKYNAKVIHSQYEPSRMLSSKQQALDLGIQNSQYEWIVLTDADMTFDNLWLSTLISKISVSPDTALVFGHTSIKYKHNFFEYFQAFQLEFLFSAAYSFHSAGITGSCMGNNIVISKVHYNKIGGFNKIGYSIVEDRALIAAFKKSKALISFVEPFRPMAFTQPAESWNDFY